ncbi:thioredoxin family protein [Spirosoma koreense]
MYDGNHTLGYKWLTTLMVYVPMPFVLSGLMLRLKMIDRKKQAAHEAVLPVLLVFMPNDAQQHLFISEVAELMTGKLKGKVQLLKIEEVIHPGVARSFDIHQLPAFVLVNHGNELWRQEGLPTEDFLDQIGLYIV